MKNEKVQNIQVLSSNPHFIFAFSSYSDKLKKGTMYRQLLDQYAKEIQISVGYVKPLSNKALVSPSDYPSLPKDKKMELDFKMDELLKTEFKPLQKGIKL